MRISKLLAVFSISAVGIFGLTGCGEEPQATSNTLKVGTTADFAPFEFHSDNQKDYQGFDIELIRAIAKDMGKEVEVNDIAFEGLFPALQSKTVDVAISAITINDERQKTVLFSDSYYKSGLAIVVREDNTDINSIDDLKGKKIAARVNTTGLAAAQKVENATVTDFQTPAECYKKLQDGEVDAVINDKPVNDYAISKGGITGLKALPNALDEEEYGIAIDKSNSALQKQINESLKKLKDNGEYDKIYEKWFGAKSSDESAEPQAQDQAQQ